MKQCWDCKQNKSFSEFYSDKSRKDGLQSRCKSCHKTYIRSRKQKVVVDSKLCGGCKRTLSSKEFHKHGHSYDGLQAICKACKSSVNRDWESQNKDLRRKQQVYRRYKLTPEEYDKLVVDSGGRCAICGEEAKLVVDHCHIRNNVRGLLCNRCNKALGLFKDSVTTLSRAIEYLSPVD